MTTEEYVVAQKEWVERTKVHKGSKVRITRIAKSDEDGWRESWASRMYECVGRIGTICSECSVDECGEKGISVCVEGNGRWFFPYFVLEPVVDKDSIVWLLAKWLSYSLDCPYGDDHVCEFRRTEKCCDIRNLHPQCGINAAKESLTMEKN